MKKLNLFILLIPFIGFSQYSEYYWEERDTWMDVNYIFQKAGIEKGSFVAIFQKILGGQSRKMRRTRKTSRLKTCIRCSQNLRSTSLSQQLPTVCSLL